MKLPPRIWALLRSRRTKYLVACSPFIFVALAALSFPISDWAAERSVERFLKSLRDRGYAASPEEYFATDGDPERDVFQHPAMIADATKPQIERFQYIEPPIPGLARRPPRCDRYFAKPTEIGALFDPPVADEREAAQRMLDAIRPQSARLDQVREAFKRPEAVWMVGWDRHFLADPDAPLMPHIYERPFVLKNHAAFCASEAVLHMAAGDAPATAENIHTLQDLVPAYLSTLATDPFDGNPLRYELMPDGSPRVWSIDADLLDEGGLPHNDRFAKGDLIWITRPIPGFTEKDLRR